jgi:hypothetical protein
MNVSRLFMPLRNASEYKEKIVQLLFLIRELNPESKLTFNELGGALLRTGLSPRMLYEHASAGWYTREMARLDEALGLPVKEVTSLGGYWQDQLIEVAKQHGKPLEDVSADLERAVEQGNTVGFFISKEELARSIVLLNGYEPVQAAFDFKASITQLQNLAGSSTEDIKAIGDAILQLAESAKKMDRAPHYHKNKAQWWKKR